MPVVFLARSSADQSSSVSLKQRHWRLPLLSGLLMLSLVFTLLLRVTAPPIDQPMTSFLTLWLISFVPYFAACLLVLCTKPLDGRGRWIEIGMILLGALVLRLLLLPVPPNLSYDSWRYIWDARITLNGYSPYAYAPLDPVLAPLRDALFVNVRYRGVPTLYPPGAQFFYLLSYLIAPNNLVVLKGIFILLDLVTCVVLAFLLQMRGLDPSRCIIYAWCPLPILEFATQGHHEAITLAFTVLAIACAYGHWRGSRVMTGFLIAMATLTNIYPILLLLVVLRPKKASLLSATPTGNKRLLARMYQMLRWFLGMCRDDWALLTVCFVTILLAYVPYILMDSTHLFGFFGNYVSEQAPNAGSVLLLVRWLAGFLRLNFPLTLLLGYGVDLLVIGGVIWTIMWRKWQNRMSMEAATLILIGTVFALSTHLYPWYTPALLPWVAVLIGPLWKRGSGLSGKAIATVALWYLACSVIVWYFMFFAKEHNWPLYYSLTYDVTVAGLAIAAIVGSGFLTRLLYAKRQRNS